MTGELKLALLVMLVTCSSSSGTANTVVPEIDTSNAELLPIVATNDPPFAAVNDHAPRDKADSLIDTTDPSLAGSNDDTPKDKVDSMIDTTDPSLAGSNDDTPKDKVDSMIDTTDPSLAGSNDHTPKDKVDSMIDTTDPSLAALNDDTPGDKFTPLISATNNPLFGALNDITPSNKVVTLIDTTTENLMTSHAKSKGSEVTSKQETRLADVTPQEGTSVFTTAVMTTSKDPSHATIRPRPVIEHFTLPTDLPITSHEDNKTKDHEMTSSHPSREMTEIPEPVATQGPKKRPEESSDNSKKKLILIVVCIVLLILVLVTVVVIMLRSRRRRGSQSFHSRSRCSNRQDVWAGQVPELGDGKMTQHPMGMENGKAGNKPEPGQEQEMSTFISSEKKDDSLVEVNEMDKGDAIEEKKPLLEDSSQVDEEPEKPPVEEQTPTPIVEQELM